MTKTKHKFRCTTLPETRKVDKGETEELEFLQGSDHWEYVGQVEVKGLGPNVKSLSDDSDDSDSPSDNITQNAREEELKAASKAFRDHAKRNDSPVFEELAEEIEEENDLSDAEDESESSPSIREGEDWESFKERHSGKPVGDIDPQTRRELKSLREGSRMRKGKGHSSKALNEHLEEKADALLNEGVDDSEHPSDKLRGEPIDAEMAQAAAQAFRDRASDPDGSNAWGEIADELEQRSTGVETEVFTDLDDTRVTHHTDGSATIKTSHQPLREELQGLMTYGDQDDPVCVQCSDQDGELEVFLEDPNEAIEELERVM